MPILWLASYPKSGNTWLRAFLANYLRNAAEPQAINALPEFALGDMRIEPYARISGKDPAAMSRDEINRLRPQAHRALAAASPGLVPVKTHSAIATVGGVPTITPEVTFGAIYVIRNPLDVAVSFSHHYAVSLDQAVKAICFRGLEIPAKEGHVVQIITVNGLQCFRHPSMVEPPTCPADLVIGHLADAVVAEVVAIFGLLADETTSP